MIQGVQALVNGSGVEKVAEYVEKGLAGAFTAAADFILSFFHLDAIPRTIRQVSDKWVDIVPRKLAELLGRLKGALLEQLQRLWGGYWGRAEWTAGNEKHKIWVDFRSGKVLVASTVQEARARLKDLRRRAAKNQKARAWVEKAEDVLKAAEAAVKEAKSATAASGRKGISVRERASAVKAAQSASTKAKESLREFAKYDGEGEKALGSCSKEGESSGCDPCAMQNPPLMPGQANYKRVTVVINPDENGRIFNFMKVESVVAYLKLMNGSDATSAATRFVRWIGKAGDDAGHVIGQQFGAKGGKTSGNIFPQQPQPGNQTTQRTRENQLATMIRDGKRVCVKITLIYDDATLPKRPSDVLYEAWVDRVQQTFAPQPIPNP